MKVHRGQEKEREREILAAAVVRTAALGAASSEHPAAGAYPRVAEQQREQLWGKGTARGKTGAPQAPGDSVCLGTRSVHTLILTKRYFAGSLCPGAELSHPVVPAHLKPGVCSTSKQVIADFYSQQHFPLEATSITHLCPCIPRIHGQRGPGGLAGGFPWRQRANPARSQGIYPILFQLLVAGLQLNV